MFHLTLKNVTDAVKLFLKAQFNKEKKKKTFRPDLIQLYLQT